MKNFIQKNLGAICAVMMVTGMFTLGFGLDWDQTQVAWKVPFATPLMIIGGVLFGAGCLILALSSGRN